MFKLKLQLNLLLLNTYLHMSALMFSFKIEYSTFIIAVSMMYFFLMMLFEWNVLTVNSIVVYSYSTLKQRCRINVKMKRSKFVHKHIYLHTSSIKSNSIFMVFNLLIVY